MSRRPVLQALLVTVRRGRCLHRPAAGAPCNAPVGAGFYPARDPRRHFLYPSVGATLAVARPTDFLQTIRRGGRLCPPADSAGTPCHALRRAGCPHPADQSCIALPAGHTGPALQKCPVGRDPCVPPHTAFHIVCHCETGSQTGRGDPFSCIRRSLTLLLPLPPQYRWTAAW